MPLIQDIFSISFNWKDTDAEADKIVGAFDKITDARNRLNQSQKNIDLFGGLAASKKSADDLGKSVDNLTKKQDDYNKSVILSEKAQQESLKTKKLMSAENDKSAKSSKAEQKAVEDLSNDYKQLSLAYNEAALKAKNLALQQGSNTPAAKAALAEANELGNKLKEVDSLTGTYNRNVGNYSSAFTGYANTLRGIRGPVKLVGEALGIGAQEADQFRIILEHSFQAIAAFFRGKEAKAAAENTDTVATEANTAANEANSVATETNVKSRSKRQKNAINGPRLFIEEGAALKSNTVAMEVNAVAAEEGAVAETELAAATTATTASFTALRVALLLTGIGVLIGLIALAVVKISEFKKSLAEARLAQDDLNEAVKSDSYKTAIENFDKLKINVDLAKQGFLDKKEVLKEYNDTLGNTTGKVNSLDEAESALVKNGPAYLQMILLQAAANIALEKAAKKAVEAEEIRQKKREEFQKSFADVRIATPGAFNAQEYDADTKRIQQAQEKRKASAVKEAADAGQKQLDIAADFQKQAADIAKKFHFDFFGGHEDDKTKDIKTIADAVAELRKALSTINEEEKIGDITPTEADVDRVKAYSKAFKDIFDRGGKANTPIVQQLLIELSPISLRVLKDTTEKFAKEHPIEFALKPPDAAKIIKIGQSYKEGEVAFTEEILQRELTLQQTASLKEQAILEDKYNHGKITREDYEKSLLDIQSKYAKEAVKTQIAAVTAEIALLAPGTKAREDAEKRLAELTLTYNKIISDDQKKKQEELIKDIQQVQEVFNQLSALGSDIVNIGITKQKNDLQDLEDLRQKNYDAEINRINNSTLSEADKADRIKVLEAQRQAQKEEYDRKNREAERKKAAYDKAVAITSIILNTAASIAKVLYDPFQVILAGALGAAQLAVAIATPLPRYAKGLAAATSDHIGVYGEAGPEIVKEPGRAPFIANKATVAFIPKSTSITPIGKDQINQVMYAAMARKTAETIALSDQRNSHLSDDLLQELIKVTKKNAGKTSQLNLHLKYDTSWEETKRKYYL